MDFVVIRVPQHSFTACRAFLVTMIWYGAGLYVGAQTGMMALRSLSGSLRVCTHLLENRCSGCLCMVHFDMGPVVLVEIRVPCFGW